MDKFNTSQLTHVSTIRSLQSDGSQTQHHQAQSEQKRKFENQSTDDSSDDLSHGSANTGVNHSQYLHQEKYLLALDHEKRGEFILAAKYYWKAAVAGNQEAEARIFHPYKKDLRNLLSSDVRSTMASYQATQLNRQMIEKEREGYFYFLICQRAKIGVKYVGNLNYRFFLPKPRECKHSFAKVSYMYSLDLAKTKVKTKVKNTVTLESLANLLLAANADEPFALYDLAIINLTGHSYYPYLINMNEAVKNLKKAAELGLVKALYKLGELYLTGYRISENNKIDQNIKLSIRYLQRAADQGYASAQYKLSTIFLDGSQNDQQSVNNARFYLRLAAMQNHPEALKKLESLPKDEGSNIPHCVMFQPSRSSGDGGIQSQLQPTSQNQHSNRR